jgi:FAD/FMN-containing dehydrogenase
MSAIAMTGLDGERVEIGDQVLGGWSRRLQGSLLRPGDARYDEVVRIWNGMVANRPALVVQADSTDDVRATVAFARDQGLLLSIKGGGHNIAGLSWPTAL